MLGLNRLGLLGLGLVLMLVVGCDGSGSSSGHDSKQQVGATDLLLYSRWDPSDALYKLDTRGQSVLLSDAVGTQGVDTYAVSPNKERVAFPYHLESGQTALAIKRLENNQLESPNPVLDGDVYLWIRWLPDSSALVYRSIEFTTFDFTTFVSLLYRATIGEPDPDELFWSNLGAQARLNFEPSADGSRLAVVAEYFDYQDTDTPASAALYLLDLARGGTPVLIEGAAGVANSFRFVWSPGATQLAWQQWYRTVSGGPGLSNDHPTGPLMLTDGAGDTRVLRDMISEENWATWTWLNPSRILVYRSYGQGGFEVIRTNGELLVSHHATPLIGRLVPSPDGRKVAFLARTEGVAGPEVYLLAPETGEYRVLGPGSRYYVGAGLYHDSVLQWSADGQWLAWNRRTGEVNDRDDLYVHDVRSAQTRVVTQDLAVHLSNLDIWFSWLPEGAVLDYVVTAENGFEFGVTDLVTNDTRVVGDMATTSCGVNRAWHSNSEVLWNRCGQGVYVTELISGTFIARRLLDGDVQEMTLTANRAFAVMQPTTQGGGDALWDATWQAYTFNEDRLQELTGTGGAICCGTLLQ